ncbi:MAG: hypothetical protein NVSMB25_19080 [Thermoleophilaceae bacterium]
MRSEHRLPASNPYPDEELVAYLEPDQLAVDANRPLPRAAVGTATLAALWLLRVFVLVVSAMVIYTFLHQLGV